MVKVFSDFDGTISVKDIGELFFRKYAGEFVEKNIERLLNSQITMQEWLKGLCDSIPQITKKEFFDFVDQFDIDLYFVELMKFCKTRNIPIFIVSDGFDLYIERVLLKNGFEDIELFANHAMINDSTGKLETSFPYTDSECNLCCNCKRNHMLQLSADEDIIVYIGDGYSDRCPIQYADFVFAKKQLIKYCQEKNITYFAFSNFKDVRLKLEEILNRKRIRHRQEAVMARREVFMQG